MKDKTPAELFFDHVRVPKKKICWVWGMGWDADERTGFGNMLVAIICQAGAKQLWRILFNYTKERKLLKKDFKLQYPFKLAELRTEIDFCRGLFTSTLYAITTGESRY